MKPEGDNDALLAQLLTGALSPDEPAVRARLAAEPQLARELAHLRRLQSDLDSERSHMEALRQETRSQAPDPADLALARRTFEAAHPGRQARRWRPGSLALAGLIAASIVVVFWWRSGTERHSLGPNPRPMLGDTIALELERSGETLRLRIRGAGSDGAEYHLRARAHSGAEVLLEVRTEANPWTLTPPWRKLLEQRKQLSVTVEVLDVNKSLVEGVSAPLVISDSP